MRLSRDAPVVVGEALGANVCARVVRVYVRYGREGEGSRDKCFIAIFKTAGTLKRGETRL